MAKKNSVLDNLQDREILWADTKRWLGLPWTFTHYKTDGERLYVRKGFWRTETEEVLLYRVLDISASQTLWQRICRVGTVTLHCTDRSAETLVLTNIRRYDKVRRFLSELVEQRRTETGVKGREIYGAGDDHDCSCE